MAISKQAQRLIAILIILAFAVAVLLTKMVYQNDTKLRLYSGLKEQLYLEHLGKSFRKMTATVNHKIKSTRNSTNVTTAIKSIHYYFTLGSPDPVSMEEYFKPWRYFQVQTCEGGYRCVWTLNASKADAVVFFGPKCHGASPKLHKNRKSSQRWVFFVKETPSRFPVHLDNFWRNKFNWTATYKRNSDVWVPYSIGYIPLTVGEQKERKILYKPEKKTGFAFIVMNQCNHRTGRRLDLVKSLQRHIEVDIFGEGCHGEQINDNFRPTFKLTKKYRFYLAFESSFCKEYVTEKFWRNGLQGEAVPVVYGGVSRNDYNSIAPPNSFVYAEDFKSVSSLAKYLKQVASNENEYSKFFEWKRKFKVHPVSMHKKFMCNLCRRLHTDSSTSIADINSFWKLEKNCVTKNKMKE